MTAGMNGLDYAIIALVGFGALYGLMRGALRMATSILSLAAGIYAASVWYVRAGAIAQQHLGTSPTVSDVIGYAAIFLVAFVAIEFAGGRVIQLAHIIHLNWIDRLGGAAFGAALAAIFAGLDLLILTALMPANSALIRDSQLAPRILAYTQALVGYVPPQVKTLYEEKRAELIEFWTHEAESPAATPKTEKPAGP